jgi:hypothetical protein
MCTSVGKHGVFRLRSELLSPRFASLVLGVGHFLTASPNVKLGNLPLALLTSPAAVGVGQRLTAAGKFRLCRLFSVCCVDFRSMWSLAVGVGHDDDSFSEMIGTQSGC